MRGRTLAVWRSIKLGAVLPVLASVLTPVDLWAVLQDQSATPDEYPTGSQPADFCAVTSETDLFGKGSDDFMPSSAAVWLPDSFTLVAFWMGQMSAESSWVCVDAAAMTTVDAEAGRADVTTGCANGAGCRGETSTTNSKCYRLHIKYWLTCSSSLPSLPRGTLAANNTMPQHMIWSLICHFCSPVCFSMCSAVITYLDDPEKSINKWHIYPSPMLDQRVHSCWHSFTFILWNELENWPQPCRWVAVTFKVCQLTSMINYMTIYLPECSGLPLHTCFNDH